MPERRGLFVSNSHDAGTGQGIMGFCEDAAKTRISKTLKIQEGLQFAKDERAEIRLHQDP